MSLKLRYKKLSKLAKLSSNVIREFGFVYFVNAAWYELRKSKLSVFEPEQSQIDPTYSDTATYNIWSSEHQLTDEIKLEMRNELSSFLIQPKVTTILSIADRHIQYLKKTLLSITEQIYENFEVRLAYSESIREQVFRIVNEMHDPRIIINSELEQAELLNKISLSATGEFLTFINCGCILTKDALFRAIKLLNREPDVDIIYFDEDEYHQDEQRRAFFKPDWAPDLFLSFDYISNFYIVRNKLFNELGGFREQFESAKHYDLLLRLTERTKKIFHIPTIAISVNIEDNAIPPLSVFERDAVNALSDTLTRRGIKGEVTNGMVHKTFRIKYLLDNKPKVTIIIPTKDHIDLLKRCIMNIEKKTLYDNYEIIIVDNNSVKEETVSYLKSLPYTVLKYESLFNFSKINNMAALHASGDYLLFLNDDAAPLDPNWLSEMVSIGIQENVGVVGAKLVLSNNTIQHAGLVFLKTGAGFHPLQGIDANSPGYFGFANVIRNFSAVTGACLLISKKIFEQIKGYDENFDLYYGDADLCLKVLNHGYRIVYTPYAKLLHEGSSSIKENSSAFFAIENHHYFIKKWPYLKNGDPFYNPNLGWDYRIGTKEKDLMLTNANEHEIKTSENILTRKYMEFINSTFKELLLRSPDKDSLEMCLSMLIYKQVTKNDFKKMVKENVEFINSTFKELLLRSPDKDSLEMCLSMLIYKQVTKNDFKKMVKENVEFINSTFKELLLRSPKSGHVEMYLSMLIHQKVTKTDFKKMVKENVEFINSTFKELLLRSPDKEGLENHLFMLTYEQVTKEEFKKRIKETEEATSIEKFSHYSDQYWNELDEVMSYLNKLSTGKENVNWMQDILTRFKEYVPFKEVLIVGCGNGWVERQLFDLGIGLHFDAFDISEKYLEDAKKEKGDRPINYFVADINNMENIENSKYDAVFNFAILHHATQIEAAMKKLKEVLKTNGLMFNWEYVGPAQNQYDDEHVKLMENIMSRLPVKLRNKYPLRPPLENFRVEPTEAIHSDLVKPMFRKYFDIIYERDLNGGVAYQILWNNINEFKNKSNNEISLALKMLLDEDFKLSANRQIPILFWYGVGTPKLN